MRAVSQSEAIATLPELLKEAQRHILIIQEQGRSLGALVSMDDLQIIRRGRLEEAKRLSQEAFDEIKANAEARGERVEDVMEELLRRD